MSSSSRDVTAQRRRGVLNRVFSPCRGSQHGTNEQSKQTNEASSSPFPPPICTMASKQCTKGLLRSAATVNGRNHNMAITKTTRDGINTANFTGKDHLGSSKNGGGRFIIRGGNNVNTSWLPCRKHGLSSRSSLTPPLAVVSSTFLTTEMLHRYEPTRCDGLLVAQRPTIRLPSVSDPSRWQKIKRKAVKALKMFARLVQLMLSLAPVAALYPLQMLLSGSPTKANADASQDAHETALQDHNRPTNAMMGWYLRMCLRCVEWSGAAVIKLMQWAGSRPDMFGHDFCSVFSQLQDNTTPHAYAHTVRMMEDAYGQDWQTKIRLDKLIGSGCIGQVYKGVVQDDEGKGRVVAIKGMCTVV